MDMNIQKYRAFLKTVEYGSFTKAAEQLHYTQSGISRMVQDLEREWDVSLLERGRRGVRPTSDGLALLPYAQRVCREYETLQEQIDYPKIDYELLLGDYREIEEWILEGRVDCGFVRLPTRPEFDTILLAQDPLLAVVPEQHPLAAYSEIPISLLCKEPFLLLEKGAKAEMSAIFEQYGLIPNVHFTTWDDYAIMSMVESGLGVSVLPELILRRIPYRIAIRRLDVPASREIGLAMREKGAAPLAVKRFLDYLQYR